MLQQNIKAASAQAVLSQREQGSFQDWQEEFISWFIREANYGIGCQNKMNMFF